MVLITLLVSLCRRKDEHEDEDEYPYVYGKNGIYYTETKCNQTTIMEGNRKLTTEVSDEEVMKHTGF